MYSPLVHARLKTSTHGLSHFCKGPGAVVNVLKGHPICAGEVSLRFKLTLNTLGGLSVPLDEKLKD